MTYLDADLTEDQIDLLDDIADYHLQLAFRQPCPYAQAQAPAHLAASGAIPHHQAAARRTQAWSIPGIIPAWESQW